VTVVASQGVTGVGVDWGDGSGASSWDYYAGGPSPTFQFWYSYGNDGPYPLTFTLVNDCGQQATATHSLTVHNVPPTVSLTLPDEVDEGMPFSATIEIADAGWLDTVASVVIDWGDGNTSEYSTATGASLSWGTLTFSHAYADDDPTGTPWDTYTMAVTVTDDDGGSATASEDLIVRNVQPSLSGAPTVYLDFDEAGGLTSIQVQQSFHDPGADDSHRVNILQGSPGSAQVIDLPVGDRSFTIHQQFAPAPALDDVFPLLVNLQDDDSPNSHLSVSPAEFTINYGESLTGDLSSYVTDPDGGTLLFSALTSPDEGYFYVDADGAFAFSPNLGFVGYARLLFGATNGVSFALGAIYVFVASPTGDPAPLVSIEAIDDQADEVMIAAGQPNTATFRVARTGGDTSAPLLVWLSITGTASYRNSPFPDYRLDGVTWWPTGYYVTIPANETQKDIILTPIQDDAVEGTETATLTVVNYTSYTIGTPGSATVSILDAPYLADKNITYNINLAARPPERCLSVNGDSHPLDTTSPREKLSFGEPYSFTINLPAGDRTIGIAWQLIKREVGFGPYGSTAHHDTIVASGTGTTFGHVFTSNDETRWLAVGYDVWIVRFFVDLNQDGTADSNEPKKAVAFDVTQDRKGIWLCRLERERTVHDSYMYSEVFGVNDVIDRLIEASENVSFSSYTGPADGTYSFVLKRIGIPDAEGATIETIIHESVHALDDANGWNSYPSEAQRIEALGWTTQHMWTLMFRFQVFEDELRKDTPMVDALRAWWFAIAKDLESGLYDMQITYEPFEQKRNVTQSDVEQVHDKVELRFRLETLMNRYQAVIDQKGLGLTLAKVFYRYDDPLSVDPPATIPDLFWH
jgi:hypothetical protein